MRPKQTKMGCNKNLVQKECFRLHIHSKPNLSSAISLLHYWIISWIPECPGPTKETKEEKSRNSLFRYSFLLTFPREKYYNTNIQYKTPLHYAKDGKVTYYNAHTIYKPKGQIHIHQSFLSFQHNPNTQISPSFFPTNLTQISYNHSTSTLQFLSNLNPQKNRDHFDKIHIHRDVMSSKLYCLQHHSLRLSTRAAPQLYYTKMQSFHGQLEHLHRLRGGLLDRLPCDPL